MMKLIFFLFFILLSAILNAQLQKGADIDGEAEQDLSGKVSMPDVNTLAIGAPHNDGGGNNSGHVRIYKWNGNFWTQKGQEIYGEAANDRAGGSISMPDANTIAIGAAGSGSNAGRVRIYEWNGNSWIQKGQDLDGEAAGDLSGISVSMPDAHTVAIGAPFNNGAGNQEGSVRIYEWQGSTWVQKGADINGESNLGHSGSSVCMPDANTVAIGAEYNEGLGGDETGHVRIWDWNGNTWIQRGNDLDGENFSNFGKSVSMPDINTIGIGAPGFGADEGQVRIYDWTGSSWEQRGLNINGDEIQGLFGNSINMPDINTVAIGAPQSDHAGNNAGQVRIYEWNGNSWVQKGINIDGETAGDLSGFVSMPDINTVAIGAPHNDGGGESSGHVRIFSLIASVNSQSPFFDVTVSPNPTKGKVEVDLGTLKKATIKLSTIDGRVLSKIETNKPSNQINIKAPKGLFIIKVKSGNNSKHFKVVKM